MHPYGNELSVAPLALLWAAYIPHMPDTIHMLNVV